MTVSQFLREKNLLKLFFIRRTSSSRRAQSGASRASIGNLSGLFGVSGQSTVSVQTPEFAIEY